MNWLPVALTALIAFVYGYALRGVLAVLYERKRKRAPEPAGPVKSVWNWHEANLFCKHYLGCKCCWCSCQAMNYAIDDFRKRNS